MSTYNASMFETFTRLTGIKVRFCDTVRDFTDLSVKLQAEIEDGKVRGWFDQDIRTIRLYTGRDTSPDAQVRESRLAANALRIALGRLGWDGLFREERRSAVMLNLKGKIELEGLYRLESLLDTASVNPAQEKINWMEDDNYASALSMFLSGIFGFHNTETIEYGVRAGMIANYTKLIEERRNVGGQAVISEQVKRTLYNENEKTFVNVGIRPHAMMRAGYKGMDMLVPPQVLRDLQGRSGLDKETFAERFVEALASPLAIIESTRFSERTNQYPYEMILNLRDKTGAFLTLVANRPETVADELLKGKHENLLLYSGFWCNPSRLVYHINNNKVRNLAERGGEGTRDFEVVRLITKGETGPEAGVNTATVVRSLKIDTNVINTFFNSKYYTEDFSKVEEILKSKEEISRKIDEGNKLQESEKPVQKTTQEKPKLSVLERLNSSIDDSRSIPDADKRKLHEMRIHTLQDLRNATDTRLRKDFSRAQVDSFECALEEMGLSFYTRPDTVSVDGFSRLPEKEKQRKAFEDSVIALQYTSREYIMAENMPLPIHLDHSPIEGEAGVQMLVKLASRARKWDWAPIFISTTEMADMGLSALEKAEPTHVKENGEWVSYYNIMDTDLKKVSPALYDKEISYMDTECLAGLPYPERILSVMLSIRDEMGAPLKGNDATERLKKQAAGMFSYYGREYTENVRKDIADTSVDYHIGNTNGKVIEDPEAYEMATEAAMFMAEKLRGAGINVEVLSSDAVTAFLEGRKEEGLPDMSIGNDGPCKVTFYDYKKFNREDILAHPETMWVTPKFASFVNNNGEVISITNPSFVKDETIQIGMFDFHFARLDHLKEIVAVGALPEELKNSISGIVSKKNTELRNALRLECALVDYLGSHGGRFDFPDTKDRCYSSADNGYWGIEPNENLYTSGFGYWQYGFGDFHKIQSMELSGDKLLFNWTSSINERRKQPGKIYSYAWRRARPSVHRGDISKLHKYVFKMDERRLSGENSFIDFIAKYSKIPTLSEHVKSCINKMDGLSYNELLALKAQLFSSIKTPIPLKYSDKELSYILVKEDNANGIQYDVFNQKKYGNKQTQIDRKLSTDFGGVKLFNYFDSEDRWEEKQLFVEKFYWNKEKKEYVKSSPMVYHIPKEGVVIIKRNNYDYFVTSPEHFEKHFNITKEGKCSVKQSAVEFSLSDGTVYGFQLGDTIYLSPEGINPNTPIHEYAHIWAKAYEKLHPEEWASLKEELQSVPLWEEIRNSADYQHISGNENRLAGEVLATIVGNKGEELLVKYAQEHPDTKDVAMFAQQFRERLTTFVVKDIFQEERLENISDVTLRILKDYAEGKGIEIINYQFNMEQANLSVEPNAVQNGTYLELTRLTQEAFGPYYPFNIKFPEPIALKDGDQTIEAVGMMMDASGNYVLRFASDADYDHNLYSEVYPANDILDEFGSVTMPELTRQTYNMGLSTLNEALSESVFVPGERYEALLSQNKDVIFQAVADTKVRLIDAAEKVEEQIQSLEALTKALPDGVYPATSEVIFTPYSQKDIEVGGISPVFKPTLVDIIVRKNHQTNEREVLYRLRDYSETDQLTTIDARSLAERHGNDPAFQKAEQMLMDIQNEKVREPALNWFNALSLEDKYRAFSFYRPSRPDESPDLVAPGFIEDSLDREHIWRTYEAAIGVPQDIAGVDDELVNKSINEMFEKTFALLSSTTLVQMQTELQLSGLGVKEEKTLSAEQDGIRYAPNGKLSNLSEEDWKLVRTPEFKQWFGDWENDPENASKVLDENCEPKALWHGSNRDFEEFDFSRLGQNLGGGEWHDRKTDEKIPDDSEKAFFFSSSKEQAISYTLLAQFRDYEAIRNDLDNLIMTLSAGRVFIPFKTKAELHDTLERTSKLVPELKPILDEINANPQRKPVTDVIDNWPKDELSAIRDVLIAKREPVFKSVHEMDRGGLSNSIFNNTRQMETVVSIINDIERLRRNDATVKNEFGTFERFSFSIFGASGNQEMDIYFDEGRCKVWIDKGKPVFLDEQNDEFVKNLCETMLSKCNAAIGRVNNEIVNTGYAENANLYRVFLNIRNPLSHDYESSPFPDKYKDTKHTTGYIAARQTAKALREGNDGVIYQNIRDPFLSDSYGVFSPEQIKIVGKEHEIKVKFTPVEVEYNADRTLEMIVTAFTGGEEMTRAAFYRATQSLSDAEFASLKEEVKTVSLDVYAEKRSSMEGATPEQIEKERERNERSVEGLSHSWFRPWTRLAGRIENDIEMKISAEGAKAVNETYFASLCKSYAAREEYAPYLDKEFKGFVCNRCKDLYLDYSKMPESLRTKELMDEIVDGYPYILESKEWEMMGTAYTLGEKDVAMTLDEGPTHENGYIGGEVKWSRYLPINGPVLPEGKITGIGQIDYKDCTNCYFIFNDKQKAVNVYEVSNPVRRQAFEQVYMQNRYGKDPFQRNGQSESIKETKNYSIMPNENVQEPVQATVRSMDTYSAYELKKLLDNVVLPAKGTDAEFDKAYEDIDKALTPGWSKDLNEGQIKKYLLDVVYGLPDKVQNFIAEAAGGLSLGKTVFDETPCDVYTLGFSTRTLDDFFVCMPPQTTVVVDMRNYPKNRHQPHFNDTALSKTLAAQGIKYINLSEKNEESFESVRQEILANPGKVLICSSESKPGKAFRGRELGPMLERSGLSVGHITQPFDPDTKTWIPTPSVITQAELTNLLLSHLGKEMANGSYRQVSFDEKGNPVLVGGATLKNKERREIVDRNIAGRWNFGSKGEIVETETPGYDSALIAASQQAHFTFVFRVGRPSGDERVAIEAAGANCIQIPIPDDPQKLTSPEYAHELIYGNKGIMDAFIRKILAQSHADPENFNPDNIVVNIEGANIARITNKPMVSGHVTEEELTHAGLEEYYKLGGSEAGVTLVRPSNATEDEFNSFIYNFLYEMNNPPTKSFMGEDIRQDNPYKIGKVITIGQSGTGYAAVLAAQKMGLEWKVQAPKGYPVVIENETLSGKTVKDQAMFCNRFKQGLSASLSEDDLRMQIDHIQSQGQNLTGPGLTDRQVLILSELGYSNSDVLTMVDLAIYNKVSIKEQPMKAPDGNTVMSGGEAFLEFIQNCVEGYGLGERKNPEMLTELTLLQLTQAEQDVDKMMFNDRRNGIGVVTVANPMYPTQLRVFEGYTTREESQGYQMFEGSVSAGKIVTEVKQERPAILRFKGNYEATRLDKVAVTGNAFSSPEARHYAERVGQELAGSDIAIVTSLRPTTAKEHSVLITSKAVLGKEFDTPAMYQAKRYTQTSSREDSETIARNAAIGRGAAAILFSPNGLNHMEDQDQIRRVVESGGVVFSIAPFGAGEGTQEDFEKVGKLSCAFAGTAIVVDSKEEDTPMSPVDEAKLAASGMYVVDYPGIDGVDYRLKGNEDAVKEGVPSIDFFGNGLTPVLEAAKATSESTAIEIQEAKFDEMAETRVKKDTTRVMNVDYYTLSVVRKGTEQVFIVPENYPDVRQAVKNTYGENVRFAENQGIAKRNLMAHVAVVGGENVRTFDGYTGTQVQDEPVYSIPLFYNKGEINSIFNAPKGTPGLIPLKQRVDNKQTFDYFLSLMKPLEKRFTDAVAPHTADNVPVPQRPLRFENAFYPVISQHSVEIYQGEELRAKVSLDNHGRLRVQNFGRLVDDLTEYKGASRDLLPNYNRQLTKADMLEMAARVECVLMGVPAEESEMFALATREEREDIQNRLANNFTTLSEDNLDVAASDILNAYRQGLLVEFQETKGDKRTAIAAIIGEQSSLKEQIENIVKQGETLDKQLADAENARDAAYGQSYSVEQYEALDKKIDEINDSKSSVLDALTSLRRQFATLEEHKERIIMADDIYISKEEPVGNSKTVTLFVDGLPVQYNPGKINKDTDYALADKAISEIKTQKEAQKASFEEAIEKIENNSITLKDIGKIYDSRHLNDSLEKAAVSEIKPNSFSNGRYIVVREGKKAYADEQYNIRSKFYDDLGPWNGRHGLATQDGKHNYIDPAGEPIVEKWFDSREQKVTEKTFVVRIGDDFGIVGDDGKLFGGRLFHNAHSSHDGWCVVQEGLDKPELAGKFNYINKDGLFLFKDWLDDASEFKNGEAVVVKKGKKMTIDTKGKEVIKQQVENPGPEAKQTPAEDTTKKSKGKGRT